jgi:hypothetical protein
MSPPATTAAPSERRTIQAASTEVLIGHAAALLAARGISRSPSWVQRTVTDYRRLTRRPPFGEYLTGRLLVEAQHRADERGRPSYADPTGNRAVGLVMRRSRRTSAPQ